MRKLGGGPSSQVEKIIFEIQEEESKGKKIYTHIYEPREENKPCKVNLTSWLINGGTRKDYSSLLRPHYLRNTLTILKKFPIKFRTIYRKNLYFKLFLGKHVIPSKQLHCYYCIQD